MIRRILNFFGIKSCKFGCHDYNQWHNGIGVTYRKCCKCNCFEVR